MFTSGRFKLLQVFLLQADGTLCTDAGAEISNPPPQLQLQPNIPTSQQVLQLIKLHLDTFGPGSYVSGSSLRSASTSLDGVVAAWSASVDAASLLPGACCLYLP